MSRMTLSSPASLWTASMAPFLELPRDRAALQTRFPACATLNPPSARSQRCVSFAYEYPDAHGQRLPAARRSSNGTPGSGRWVRSVLPPAHVLCSLLYSVKAHPVGAHLLNRRAPASQSASTTYVQYVRSCEAAP